MLGHIKNAVRFQNKRLFLQKWTALSHFSLLVAKNILITIPDLSVIGPEMENPKLN